MGLRHIVMWKFGGADQAECDALAAAFASRLEALLGNVPTLIGIEAKMNVVDNGQNWDLVLLADFQDQAGLEAYASHPDHVAVAKDLGKDAVQRAAIDIQV